MGHPQSDHDPASVSIEQARERIQHFLLPPGQQEIVGLHTALQRTLAGDVLSPINVPPHDYSAMDGYALRYADLGAGAARLTIMGSSYAGHPFNGTVSANECTAP